MENVNVLASHYGGKGLTQREAVSRANRLRRIILPNPLADIRIVRTDAWKKEKNAYPIWVSPLVAYRHDRNVFGPTIEYTDPWTGEVYHLDIPERFRQVRQGLLAIEHGFLNSGTPTFEYIKTGKKRFRIRVPDESVIVLAGRRPYLEGWRMTDKKFGLPIRDEFFSQYSDTPLIEPHTRYRELDLCLNNDYIGLTARDGPHDHVSWRAVDIGTIPSRRFGMLTLNKVSEQIKAETGQSPH